MPFERRSASIRKGRPGDLGWTFHRQAEVYAEEFGYSPLFERYVAHGLAPFLDHFDASRDGLWMAWSGGRRVGFIAIQHDPERRGWAKLRWYLVEKDARGMGVGGRLLRTAITFARKAGYKGIHLWTVDDLVGARRQYEKAGFTLAYQDPKPCAWAPWGHEQRWELPMASRRAGAGPGKRATKAPRRAHRR